jgi:HD-GYP domain-containing protein (c-di-GMP phosphodiesterase class II)
MLLSLKSDQIMEGMLLGQDITSDDGVLLMPVGKLLQEHDIFWIDSIFNGHEVLIDEPRLKQSLSISKETILRGVTSSLKQEVNFDTMYLMMSILRDSIGGYFAKLYPQLIDLRKSDPITFEHSLHVTWYTLFLGSLVGLDEEELMLLLQAAVLHDIGKSYIPSTLLTKVAKLTPEEFGIIKKHPEYGELWSKQFAPKRVSDMIRQHHEYPNGKGYPDGLRGDQLDYVAHIITVVDVFDALSSSRSYREGMSPFKAYTILMQESMLGRLSYPYVVLFRQVLDCLAGEEVLIGTSAIGVFKGVVSITKGVVCVNGREVTINLNMLQLLKPKTTEIAVEL